MMVFYDLSRPAFWQRPRVNNLLNGLGISICTQPILAEISSKPSANKKGEPYGPPMLILKRKSKPVWSFSLTLCRCRKMLATPVLIFLNVIDDDGVGRIGQIC